MFLDTLQLIAKLNRIPDGILTNKEKIYLTELVQKDVLENKGDVRQGNAPRKVHVADENINVTKNGWGRSKTIEAAISKRIGNLTYGDKEAIITKTQLQKIAEKLGCPMQLIVELGVKWGRLEVIGGGIRYKILPLRALIHSFDENYDAQSVASLLGCAESYVLMIRNEKKSKANILELPQTQERG